MAPRPKTICRHPGCQKLVDAPGFCAAHAADAVGWRRTSTESTTKRGYGYEWQKKVVRIKHRDKGLCQHCLRGGRVNIGSEVDHIIEKVDGGTDDDDNLELKCSDCHKAKTIRERAARQMRR
ncbi:HNH endonuclease [Herbaspirillum sp. NPDC101397]|uniref:HNH endonuclease n=1 Tax=Herbaspirillum sp. NPDC101397 TaxID=3364006 RepID=UPI003839E6CB